MSAAAPPGDDAKTVPSDVLDLRLVPAALLTWLVVILGLTSGWPAAAFASGAAVLTGLVAWGRITRRVSRRDPSNPAQSAHPAPPAREARTPQRGGWAHGLLAAAGCVAAAGLVVAANVAQVVRHPLRDAAAQGSAATVRVVITGDPTPLLSAASDGYGGRQAGATEVTISAELVSASSGGLRWTTGGRVLLIASRAEWASVLPGVELTASGLLSPATRADLTVAVLRVRGPPADPTEPPWWQRGADALRDGLRRAVATALPEHSAQLLPGLAIGDTGTMSWTLREDFRATGLTHLVAVSGANLVIVCGAVFGLLGLLRAGPRTRVLMALLALVGFVLLARPSPSVLRAAVMGGVGLLAVLAGRRRPVIPALAASVIGLLLVDPALGTDPGFALSVLATAALVVLAPPWAAWLRGRGVPSGVAEALAVPVAAHLVTAPVVAGFAGQVSLVAVIANLLAAPVVAPVTVLGVLAAVVSPASAALAELCVRVAGPLVAWLVAVARWGAGVPGGSVPWPAGVGGALLLAATVGAVLVMFRHRRVRALVVAALLGALLVLVPTRFATPGWPVDGWSVVACDVGQGDAVVLATGQPGRAVLIDAGTEAGAVDGCLSRLRVRALSLIVISHLHADHIGGLAAALGGRAVGAVAVGPAREPRWAFEQVRRLAADVRIPVVQLRAGQRLSWPGLTMDVLAPREPPVGIDPDDGTDVNNTSLVLRASTRGGTVLLPGDIELLAQANLLSTGAELHADVLKVPHHGSRYTAPGFLAAVHPRLALVSVGAGNRYGHPSAAVLDALARGGALIRRTDQSGDVALVAARDGPVAVARGHPRPAPRRG